MPLFLSQLSNSSRSGGIEFVLLGVAVVLTLAILTFFVVMLSRKEK